MQTDFQDAFDHLIDSLNNPQLSISNQEKFNQDRLQKVTDAMKVRPCYIPIQISLPPQVQTLPTTVQSNPLSYDSIVVGAISDGESKRINFKRDGESSTPFVSVGKEIGSQISLDAIAGKSLESGGTNDIQRYLPFLLRANQGLSVDLFKPVATNGIDVVSICFLAYRVFKAAAVNEEFTAELKEKVLAEIDARVTPEPRFSVCPVVFGNDGTAQAETPSVREPRIVRGFRTTVKNAMVNLGFDTDSKFARDFFPIWALAAESGNNTKNYRMLERPIFLKPYQQLYFSLKNTINGTTFADNGQIEILQQTV